MINLQWLRTFCTLAEQKHFTQTATRLHMTQSGVSQHIHKLEAQLGQALLIRQGKQFSLSEAGKQLYQDGRRILQSLNALEQRLGDDPAYEGPVRIASPGSVGLKLYPRLLELQHQHRKLAIDYRFAPNGDIAQWVAEDRIDIGLITQATVSDDITTQALTTEALLLVTPKATATPSWQTLCELGFINHPDGHYHANLLLAKNYPQFKHISQLPQSGFSNQISLILEPVARGLGFSVLPQYAVDAFGDQAAITAHRLTHSVHETLYLVAHPLREKPRRVVTVLKEITQCLAI